MGAVTSCARCLSKAKSIWVNVLMMLVISSCAHPFYYIDETFDKYISKFEGICNIQVKVGVAFRPLANPATIGTCSTTKRGKTVYIDPELWVTMIESEKEWIVFHELGHCVLKKKHYQIHLGTCPVSIMHPYNFGASGCYRDNLEYYYSELCGGTFGSKTSNITESNHDRDGYSYYPTTGDNQLTCN